MNFLGWGALFLGSYFNHKGLHVDAIFCFAFSLACFAGQTLVLLRKMRALKERDSDNT